MVLDEHVALAERKNCNEFMVSIVGAVNFGEISLIYEPTDII